MRSSTVIRLFSLALVCSNFLIRWSEAELVLHFQHRFSDKARERHNARRLGEWPFPKSNSLEYQKFLYHHDVARHGRMLATAEQESYTFLEGNYTALLFGGLYYATIDVGTPEVPFLVVLDTGSDLFWLPCECQSCAPATSPIYQDYGITAPLREYSPSNSKTSKDVSCGSEECSIYIRECLPEAANQQCQYRVNYASVNTSSSGKLVEDVIHLVPNSGDQTRTTVPIVLGCGQVQTGSFVDGTGAPDGLIGLGLQNFSVPALLAKSGLVKDSFSMCLDADGSGRVVFGDIGNETQKTTPFLKSANPKAYDTYYLGVDSIVVGRETIPVGEVALFDTGTTFTYLNSSTYQAYISKFDQQVTSYPKIKLTGEGALMELCYRTSDTTVDVPNIDFIFRGNASFTIQLPFLTLYYANNTIAGFCLAVLESNVNIIGANYMMGNNLVFNRQERTLGFQEGNCYDVVANAGTTSAAPPSSAPSTPKTPSRRGDAPSSSPSPPLRSQESDASATSFSLSVTLLSLGLVHLFL